MVSLPHKSHTVPFVRPLADNWNLKQKFTYGLWNIHKNNCLLTYKKHFWLYFNHKNDSLWAMWISGWALADYKKLHMCIMRPAVKWQLPWRTKCCAHRHFVLWQAQSSVKWHLIIIFFLYLEEELGEQHPSDSKLPISIRQKYT